MAGTTPAGPPIGRSTLSCSGYPVCVTSLWADWFALGLPSGSAQHRADVSEHRRTARPSDSSAVRPRCPRRYPQLQFMFLELRVHHGHSQANASSNQTNGQGCWSLRATPRNLCCSGALHVAGGQSDTVCVGMTVWSTWSPQLSEPQSIMSGSAATHSGRLSGCGKVGP